MTSMQQTDYGRLAVGVILGVVVYYVFRILRPFLPALVWAAVLATVFHPLYAWLRRRLSRPRLASALACVLLTVLIVLPVILLIFLLAEQSVGAYHLLEERLKSGGTGSLDILRRAAFYQWLVGKLREWGLPEPDLGEAAMRAVHTISQFLVGHSASIVSGLTHFVLNFLVMLLTLYHLFLSGPDLLHELRQLSPLRHEHEDRIIEKFRGLAVATFGGSLAVAAIQGAAGGLVFLFFGLPSPLLWGAVIALLSLVPLVGTAFVWGPLVVYYLLIGAYWKGITLLVLFAGVVGTIDNIVRPLVIRRGTEINTLWVFLSVLGGIGAFGFLGFFLGPLIVTLLFVLIDIYKVEFHEELGEKLAPSTSN
jgi:predicted PurR-regulated permease PerM